MSAGDGDEGPALAIDLPMGELIAALRDRLTAGARVLRVLALDPDRGRGRHAGERVGEHVHRPYRVWVDLAGRLGLRMATPRRVDADTLELRFERLDGRAGWQTGGPASERYGPDSEYARISKLEDPDLMIDLEDALVRAGLPAEPRILELGANRGDGLAMLIALRPALAHGAIHLDFSTIAPGVAKGIAAAHAECGIDFVDAPISISDVGGGNAVRKTPPRCRSQAPGAPHTTHTRGEGERPQPTPRIGQSSITPFPAIGTVRQCAGTLPKKGQPETA